jgi:NifB/MoaA-like Fe-S oxidoreductase
MVESTMPGLDIRVIVAGNSTFGRPVTVSGLLCAADIAKAVKRKCAAGEMLVIPPNAVNHEGLMLDDLTPEQLGKELGMKVIVPEENFLEKGVLSKIRSNAG